MKGREAPPENPEVSKGKEAPPENPDVVLP